MTEQSPRGWRARLDRLGDNLLLKLVAFVLALLLFYGVRARSEEADAKIDRPNPVPASTVALRDARR